MTIEKYIDNINQRYKLGNATEHTFRGDLQQLLESLVPEIRATNEPKRQSCGAPDYILTKKDIPVGFIEAKDIGDSHKQTIGNVFTLGICVDSLFSGFNCQIRKSLTRKH
jgi:hypothetical protein